MANQAVYGIVATRAKLERIVQDLQNSGVDFQSISFLSQQGQEFPEFPSSTNGMRGTSTTGTSRNWRTEERLTDYPAGSTPEERFRSTDTTSTTRGNTFGTNGTTRNGSTSRNDVTGSRNGVTGKSGKNGGLGTEKHTKAPEGATAGGTAGGIIGGVLGLLAGIGALAIPGIGPFIAAGPLLATLSGIGVGGTLGGVIGALIGAGIPEYEAKRYENRLKEGGILVSIRATTDAEAKRIKEVLQRNGAEDVSVSSEATTSKNYKK